MVKDSYNSQIRIEIAQLAASMMAEDGIRDFAYAKKKAARQLGCDDNGALPTNAEVEAEIRIFHALYNADTQPESLLELRKAAFETMQVFERFNPHLTGGVLDGTAGKYAQTDIHLFADSVKEVEIFLLNKHIPFENIEKTFRVSDKPSKDKKDKVRKTVPAFKLETELGLIKLSVFDIDDVRVAIKKTSDGSNAARANIDGVAVLLGT